jgi:Xaa-Pro aminopeptidase
MPQTHAARRARLAAGLAAREIDAALITHLVNVHYLTGLASSNAALWVHAGGKAVLATDSRYAGTAERECPDLELVVEKQTAAALVERGGAGKRKPGGTGGATGNGNGAATDTGISGAKAVTGGATGAVRRLAYEEHEVTVERFELLAQAIAPGIEPVRLGRAVEELRQVKDDGEIALLAEACAITDGAFDDVLPMIRPGVSERDLAVALERRMVDRGADRPGFDSIVASGPNGAVPHHRPGDRVIATGDLVTIDCGARYRGYHADMTRTVAVGRPAEWQRELYELVAAAQRAGCAAARPGAETKRVDAAAREVIKAAGHADHFPHGLGHGVGLEIHEAPFLRESKGHDKSNSHDKTGRLDHRVPVTIEPGVYVSGRGGIRIEDTVVVRADGPQILTQTTKELLVL